MPSSIANKLNSILCLRTWWHPGLLVLVLLFSACANEELVAGPVAMPSNPVDSTIASRIAKQLASQITDHPGRSGFVLLNTGLEAFAARIALIRAADRKLDVQTYILREDDSGRLVLNALLDAADRGVRVRILLDDLNLTGLYRSLAVLDAHMNIEVKLFNPFVDRGRWARVWGFLTDFGRVSRRMHNKFIAADNLLGIVGGRNLGAEYYEALPELDFLDIDVLSVGPIVQKVTQKSFDAYWNSRWAVTLIAAGVPVAEPQTITSTRSAWAAHAVERRGSTYADAVHETPLAKSIMAGELRFTWADASVVADAPDKILSTTGDPTGEQQPKVFQELREVTTRTQWELLLISPYFVPGEYGVTFLAQLRKRGVRVRILTNSLAATDSISAFSGYQRYRRSLLEAGVELYEIKSSAEGNRRLRDASLSGSNQASLHAKTFVYDRERFFIGSLNLDPRSFWLNTETGLFIDSVELSRQVATLFDEAIEPQASYHVQLAKPEDNPATARRNLTWTTQEDGNVVVHKSDPESSIPRRLAAYLLRILPIEDQL